MPLYEYECDACNHRFEVIQKFSDPPVDKCTKCGGAVRKLLSSPAIQFKGSGWYVTDYARKSTGNSSSSKSDSKSDSSSGSDSSSTTPASSTPDTSKSSS